MSVDRPAGSEKTTFAGRLAAALGETAELVHMEDPYAGRTLTGAVARLAAGVLAPLPVGPPGHREAPADLLTCAWAAPRAASPCRSECAGTFAPGPFCAPVRQIAPVEKPAGRALHVEGTS